MFHGRDASLNFTPNLYYNSHLNHEEQIMENEVEREEEEEEEEERENMFEKPLTPSDVGKLNRLVIPKQHAEKYFPLVGGDSAEKGLLLSFEDESGKTWKFRYSYWNSSQSYVLTKGWSRFVKEKQLDAGDVIYFERRRNDAGGDLVFIRWKRRVTPVQDSVVVSEVTGEGNTGDWTPVFYPTHPYPSHLYQSDSLHSGAVIHNHTATGNSNSKRLRLFGVNLDCELDGSEPSGSDGSSLSSQGRDQLFFSQAYGSDHFSNKDLNFPRDTN